MQILHTSDWHVGRTLHGESLSDSIDAFFTWLKELVIQRKIDVVLISGDVFDRSVPPVHAVRQVSRYLTDLAGHTRIILTSGNHDGPIRLGMFSDLLSDSLVIATEPEQIGTAIECGTVDDGALIYPVPYLEPDLVRQILSDQEIDEETSQPVPLARSHEAVMGAALRRIHDDLRQRRVQGDVRPAIAMPHAFITGGSASDSEHNIEVGGVAHVPAGIFDTLGGKNAPVAHLAYVAAGHLHRPQQISGTLVPVFYSGSPVAYSFSEYQVNKRVYLLDTEAVDEAGYLHPQPIDIPVHRPIAVLRGTMDQLITDPDPNNQASYCSITVTDDLRPDRMIPRLKTIYPYALIIQHESSLTPPSHTGVSAVSSRSDTEISLEFFELLGGAKLTDTERGIIQDTWEQVRKQA